MRLITLAIHTYDRALALKQLLEAEGVAATLQNVNLENPEISSGVRVRIDEKDLPLALRIVENPEMFSPPAGSSHPGTARRTILVPVDFSKHSMNAVYGAVRLAAARKSDISFIHSYIDPRLSGTVSLSDSLSFDPVDNDDSIGAVSAANNAINDFADNLRDKMKKGEIPLTRFTLKVVEGVPEDAINGYTKEISPYLIVMGTRSAEQKEKEMIGSVTASVLDSSRFPVLTIPANADYNKCLAPENILFFSNLDQEDIIAMDALYRFFPAANPKVTIVNIPGRNKLNDLLSGNSAIALSEYCSKNFKHFTFQTIPITAKRAVYDLRKAGKENKFDLIVLPSHRKNAFSRLFNPGLPYRIALHADTPMLVIPV